MTARVDIDVATLDDALLLPVEAVWEEGGRHHCLVARRGRLDDREVEVGPSNKDYVAILAGLGEGESVSLAPRARRSGLFGR
jgi:multidrug efflux pump subunit AcrA (membrane-fusion protein)